MASKREISIIIAAVDKASRTLRTVSKSASSGLKSVANAATEASRAMAAVGAGLSIGLGLAVKTTADFQQAMANTQSVIGATADELGKLTANAREMGRTTIFSATESANAMYFLASAGLNTEQIIQSLEGTLKLAAATQADLSFTTSTVVSTISAFGLAAAEADRVANTFAATISASQATMDKLSVALSFVAPVARSVNMSLEETTAILGSLFNAGIQASTAGTALRMSIAQLLKPSKEQTDAINRLGISILDSEKQLRSMTDIIRDLEEVGLSTADAMLLFGVRAGPAMLALVNQGADAIENLTKKVTGTDKAADMAALQIDTFNGQMKLMKSALQELQIVIGNKLLPILTEYTTKLTEIINKTSIWSEQQPKITKHIVLSAGALTVLLTGLGTLGLIIPKIAQGILTIGGAIGKLIFRIELLFSHLNAISIAGTAISVWLAGIAAGAITFVGALKLATNQIDKEKEALTSYNEVTKNTRSNIDKIVGQLKIYQDELDNLNSFIDKGVTHTSQWNEEIELWEQIPINERVAELTGLIDNLNFGLKQARGQIQNGIDVTKSLTESTGLLNKILIAGAKAWKDLGQAMFTMMPNLMGIDAGFKAFAQSGVLSEDSPFFKSIEASREEMRLWKDAAIAMKEAAENIIDIRPTGLSVVQGLRLETEESFNDLQKRIRLREKLLRSLDVVSGRTTEPQAIPPPAFIAEPSREELRNFEVAWNTAQGNMKEVAIANLRSQLDAFAAMGIEQSKLAEFEILRRQQIEDQYRVTELSKSDIFLNELNARKLASEVELRSQLNSIRESTFQMEQDRIKALERGYIGYIRTISRLSRQFFSDQAGGWLRGMANLVRFITQSIANSKRELAMEKLKEAASNQTTAQVLRNYAKEQMALGALATLQAAFAAASLNFVQAAAFGAVATQAGIAAGASLAQAASLGIGAKALQAEAAVLMTSATAIEAVGEATATGMDLAADATRRAARESEMLAREEEQRLNTELQLKQRILDMEGRTLEARQLGFEAEVARLREQNVNEDLIRRYEQLSSQQIGQNIGTTPIAPIVPTGGDGGNIGDGFGTTVYQSNTFIGIASIDDQVQLREWAEQLVPFIEEIQDKDNG